jgi:GlcNAc-P-P-Und epimerase
MSKKKILITGGSGFIGTNLINSLVQDNNISILNIDLNKPSSQKHYTFWKKCDIMNFEKLNEIFQDFKPSYVIHLAAKTDTSSDILDDYKENTIGTLNVINCINNLPKIKKVIITSTQYVYKSIDNPFPINDTDYKPHTAYGVSKKISEDYTRDHVKHASWTIIRPTNIWGPWNYNYPNGLYKAIQKGFYVNPSKMLAFKSYGFVFNIVHQITSILFSEINITDKKVFYVGEEPMSSRTWVNTTYYALKGSLPISVPNFILSIAAFFGDLLGYFEIKFPLTSLRLANMLDSYFVPIDKTIKLFGVKFDKLEDNVNSTIEWLNDYQKGKFNY